MDWESEQEVRRDAPVCEKEGQSASEVRKVSWRLQEEVHEKEQKPTLIILERIFPIAIHYNALLHLFSFARKQFCVGGWVDVQNESGNVPPFVLLKIKNSQKVTTGLRQGVKPPTATKKLNEIEWLEIH